jgi:hypothetical protein
MPVSTEPSIRQAALLTMYWQAHDVEAVVILLAELTEGRCACQDLEDLVTALLIMRDKPMSQVRVIATALPETV